MIASGHLKAGARLPPERELARLFGVGRCTLREAVRALESLGLVDVRAGEGTFLTESDAAPMRGYFSPELFSKWSKRLNLFELRAVLEPGLASLAARRATPDHLAKMREVLEEQALQVQRGDSGMEEDAIFHRLIAEATANPALIEIMETLTHVLRETRHASLQRDGRPMRSLKQHTLILAAIEARNPAVAARRMRSHIQSLERALFVSEVQPVKATHVNHRNGNGTP
jgi:GntR family transcriptional repressor for pyruvate dehydrogenase complex